MQRLRSQHFRREPLKRFRFLGNARGHFLSLPVRPDHRSQKQTREHSHTLSIRASVSMKLYLRIMIRSYRGAVPQIAASAYIDPSAQIIGDVTIGERSSVWPNASVRGDVGPIRIGSETSIQDNSALHLDEGFPLTIGDRVVVGHSVTLHGCTVEDDSLIGIGSIVLNGARVGKGAVIAAGALVPEGMEVPPFTLVMGAPAKPRRAGTPAEPTRFGAGAPSYAARARIYNEEESKDRARGIPGAKNPPEKNEGGKI